MKKKLGANKYEYESGTNPADQEFAERSLECDASGGVLPQGHRVEILKHK